MGSNTLADILRTFFWSLDFESCCDFDDWPRIKLEGVGFGIPLNPQDLRFTFLQFLSENFYDGVDKPLLSEKFADCLVVGDPTPNVEFLILEDGFWYLYPGFGCGHVVGTSKDGVAVKCGVLRSLSLPPLRSFGLAVGRIPYDRLKEALVFF
ncbi:hypothetical protein OUZ56_025532 [Daphnia magna]|uniref:Uncharacterized protein n=1 Tax=Daphnia magna TaxID=35525 RepID=A0ABQ9ZKP5_9CRUS|nr:hypothetical protein OUZ56_025532 [Daphnia magna]